MEIIASGPFIVLVSHAPPSFTSACLLGSGDDSPTQTHTHVFNSQLPSMSRSDTDTGNTLFCHNHFLSSTGWQWLETYVNFEVDKNQRLRGFFFSQFSDLCVFDKWGPLKPVNKVKVREVAHLCWKRPVSVDVCGTPERTESKVFWVLCWMVMKSETVPWYEGDSQFGHYQAAIRHLYPWSSLCFPECWLFYKSLYRHFLLSYSLMYK